MKSTEEKLREILDACGFPWISIYDHKIGDSINAAPSDLLELYEKGDPRINGLSKNCIILAKAYHYQTLINTVKDLKIRLSRLLMTKKNFATPHEYAMWMSQCATPKTYNGEPEEYLKVRIWHIRAKWAVLADLLIELGL